MWTIEEANAVDFIYKIDGRYMFGVVANRYFLQRIRPVV